MPPFDAAMARRHKKGMSPKQIRQWRHVAQSVYDKCIQDGGSAATCEPRAIRAANGVTGTPRGNAASPLHLWTHTAHTAVPKVARFHDRDYLTAPVVMLISGVLNGGLVPAESLIPDMWNGVPLVVSHPKGEDGWALSARHPTVLESYGIGHVYHTRFGQGTRNGFAVPSLVAEIWVDIERAKGLGGEALQALQMIESQQPLEVSTAFFCDADATEGDFYGTPYNEVLRNLRPDHLALLPNEIGACSNSDGCGVPFLNHQSCACGSPGACQCHDKEKLMDESPRGWRAFATHMLRFFREEVKRLPLRSHTDEPEQSLDPVLRERFEAQLAQEQGTDVVPIEIVDIDPETNSFLYRAGDVLYRRYYQTVEDVVTLTEIQETLSEADSDDPASEDVETVGDGTDSNDEADVEVFMSHPPTAAVKSRVNALITNERTKWTERERHYLEQQEEGFLILLEQMPLLPEPATHAGPPSTIDEALSYIPEEFGLRESIRSAWRQHERRKTKLIEVIKENQYNVFKTEQLQAMDEDDLAGIIMMTGAPLPDQPLHPQPDNYQGRHVPKIHVVKDEHDEVPPPPDTLTRVLAMQRELGLRA